MSCSVNKPETLAGTPEPPAQVVTVKMPASYVLSVLANLRKKFFRLSTSDESSSAAGGVL